MDDMGFFSLFFGGGGGPKFLNAFEDWFHDSLTFFGRKRRKVIAVQETPFLLLLFSSGYFLVGGKEEVEIPSMVVVKA